MSLDAKQTEQEPIRGKAELVELLRSAERPTGPLLLGLEHERLMFPQAGFEPVPLPEMPDMVQDDPVGADIKDTALSSEVDCVINISAVLSCVCRSSEYAEEEAIGYEVAPFDEGLAPNRSVHQSKIFWRNPRLAIHIGP